MRLFIALDLPKTIKDRLFLLEDKRLSGARWTNSQQWHITLHFIGETDNEAVIRDGLHEVHAESFSTRLRGIGAFPAKGKPNILWAGVYAPPELNALHEALGKCLKGLGIKLESRAYSPHLTLARFSEQSPKREILENYYQQFYDFETEEFLVDSFTLYRSDLQRSGAAYSVREHYPLIIG